MREKRLRDISFCAKSVAPSTEGLFFYKPIDN